MLEGLRDSSDPRLLVGADNRDDAGAVRLRDDLVILQTADVIAPVCDDPFRFGAIAAANALSDVYAMGGKPLSAINLAFFPERMPMEAQNAVLRGARDKCEEAGALLIGGHTVTDREVKFGLSVIGTAAPDEVLQNSGAQVGDRLVITKPIGTGLLLTAMKKGWLSDVEMTPCWEAMAVLNDVAAREALRHGAHAATDVTGFGLGGHAAEMARASGATIEIRVADVPRYEQADGLLRRRVRTAITADNAKAIIALMADPPAPRDPDLALLADPQTSGGLLVALPADRSDAYVATLRQQGVAHASIIGEVIGVGSGLSLR